jgi:hypothetical protein
MVTLRSRCTVLAQVGPATVRSYLLLLMQLVPCVGPCRPRLLRSLIAKEINGPDLLSVTIAGRFLGNCVSCPNDGTKVIGYLVVLALLWIVINLWFARAVENLMVIVGFCQLMSIVVTFSLNWPSMVGMNE